MSSATRRPGADCSICQATTWPTENVGSYGYPSALEPPSGCKFHPRCPHAMAVCKTDDPEFVKLADGREAACHLLSGPHATM